MGVRLPRWLGSADDLPQGMFVHVVSEHIAGVAATVYIACPSCGTKRTLTRDHKIKDGKVTPALACANKACSFLDYVELESWGVPV